ncbi:MAG TPA: hypothetical protein VJ770_22700 [Stellaceae bacterium]|nr:hypothetical protein [Stellaceae bacterium]
MSVARTAIIYHSGPDSHILALLGSIVRAKTYLEAPAHVWSFDEVRVWSRREHGRRFAAEHSAARRRPKRPPGVLTPAPRAYADYSRAVPLLEKRYETGLLVEAATIEELAAGIAPRWKVLRIDTERMRATIAQYNAAADRGDGFRPDALDSKRARGAVFGRLAGESAAAFLGKSVPAT